MLVKHWSLILHFLVSEAINELAIKVIAHFRDRVQQIERSILTPVRHRFQQVVTRGKRRSPVRV